MAFPVVVTERERARGRRAVARERLVDAAPELVTTILAAVFLALLAAPSCLARLVGR